MSVSRSVVRATVSDWLDYAEDQLGSAGLAFGHGAVDASQEANWLVAATLGVPFGTLDALAKRALPAKVANHLAERLERRISTRVPLAYILNEAWLGVHRFYVDERVIVPRSFIAEILRRRPLPWPALASREARVLDLCTGSGCLAIVAALAMPRAQVDAVDVSRAAIQVARRNVRDYKLGARVRTVESNLFQALAGTQYDLILSNPPYVNAAAMRRLPREYRHEPKMSLAGGRDGLDLVGAILRDASQFLTPTARLVLEIGHNRKAFEARWPDLPVRWLATSVGRDMVCMIGTAALQKHVRERK